MKHRVIHLVSITTVVWLLVACSTSNQGLLPEPNRAPRESFSVTVDEGLGTFVPALAVEETATGATVTVTALEASGLEAAYVHVHYDATTYSPERVEFGDCLGQLEQVLTLALTDVAGEVPVGIRQIPTSGVLPLNGEGLLTKIHFDAEPFTATRAVSGSPTGDRNAVDDLKITRQGTVDVDLSWSEKNVGDYDNNSEVNISDLTPLGTLLNQQVASAQDPIWAAMVDGDGNGTITIADITPIGQFYGNVCDGYILYIDVGSATPYGTGITAQRANFYTPGLKHPVVYTFTADYETGTPPSYTVKPVAADDVGNPGPPSNLAQLVDDPGPPNAPTDLVAESSQIIGVQKIRLTWTKSAFDVMYDIATYEIERKLNTEDDTAWTQIIPVSGSANTYDDYNEGFLEVDYDYRVRAKDFSGLYSADPEYSNVATATPYFPAPPSPPIGVQAHASTSAGSAIDISWNAPLDGSAQRFNLYRQAPGETEFVVIYPTPNNLITSYTDEGLTLGETYEYYVTSIGQGSVESDPSTTVNAQPSDLAPIQITDLTTDKTTHYADGGDAVPSTITVTTDQAADSYEWDATVGSVDGTGATVTYSPPAGTTPQVVTITCTANKGGSEDSESLELYLTEETIKTAYGNGGKFTDFNNMDAMSPLADGGDLITDPKRSFSYYADGAHVVSHTRMRYG